MFRSRWEIDFPRIPRDERFVDEDRTGFAEPVVEDIARSVSVDATEVGGEE